MAVICTACAFIACTEGPKSSGVCGDEDGGFLPFGVICREAKGACDAVEFCSGASAECPPDGFRDGRTECRAAAGECDVAESCSGSGAACPEDTFRDSATECRAAAGPCDQAETCSGREAACPGDARKAAGVTCREANGACDVAETCNGASASCPTDALAEAGTECRAADGACDRAETCSGSSRQCPTDRLKGTGTVCRAAAGACDVEEKCSGTSSSCPEDRFRSASTQCRASAGACDVAERCTGEEAECPADEFRPASEVCRASAGACDEEEHCTGANAACPVNEFAASTVVCRPANGDCDVAEKCTGTQASCPSNGYAASSVVCRESAGACDVEERCSGSGASCPSDARAAATVVCRAAAGSCDLDETCNGTGVNCPVNAFRSSSTVCRQAASDCDAAESCSGTAASCPADATRPTGSGCTENGGNTCNAAGQCVHSDCANLCQQQVTCPGQGSTRLTGTVFMPNGVDPLPDTLVFVPNAPLAPLTAGVQGCQSCESLVSGSPLVSTRTDHAGRFTLTNVPVGTNIPLVIQHGKWRRQFEIPNVTACADTATGSLRMPANRTEGDLPKIALVNGAFGAYECVLRKMGLSASEFGNAGPGNEQRVQFYRAYGNAGARIDDNTPPESGLYDAQVMRQFDLVILGCEGGFFDRPGAAEQALLSYVNAGGHVLVNHYQLEWYRNVQPLWGTANWNLAQSTPFAADPAPGTLDTSFPEGAMLAQWLSVVDPAGTAGQVTLHHLYWDFDSVVAPSKLWLSLTDANHANPVPMQYTFKTPVGVPPAQQCGNVIYTGYHTMEHFPGNTVFPSECTNNALRGDEKMIEFLLFTEGSCR